MPSTRSAPFSFPLAWFSLAGLAVTIFLVWKLLLPGATTGRNDFLALYAGARLAGTTSLYDADSVYHVEHAAAGEWGASLLYSRLPCFALLLKPVAALPYRAAWYCWLVISGASLFLFTWLWPAEWRIKAPLICWSIPGFIALFNGQDVTLLLMWFALGLWLERRGHSFLAGLALVMCGSKFHLAVLFPAAIIARKRWRVAAGLLAGAGALLLLCFPAAGWDWPAHYFAVLADPRIHPSLDHMPNLHGLFPGSIWISASLACAVVFAVWWGAKVTQDFDMAMAIALAAGLLVSYHAYISDAAVLIPAMVLALERGGRITRFSAFLLASPVAWFWLQMRGPFPDVARFAILAFVIAISCAPQLEGEFVGEKIPAPSG